MDPAARARDPEPDPMDESPADEETTNIKVARSLHTRLDVERQERNTTVQHVVDVLLRYGLRDAEIAFAEWNRNASRRARKRHGGG